jgi:hypothetical protein
LVWRSRPAILPISVCMPVAVTTAHQRPQMAAVPLNTIFERSPLPTSSVSGSVSLETGRLSPVSEVSAAWSAMDWISRPSAGMVSPYLITMMSPRSRSVAGTR